ncbi:VOC family protein [Paenibacillus filicis]|uniref:VOC family protein n=1 Tax=Paenibacillus filicis TaxID=669464 RepID=A0ABU9DGE3_9BACL
MAKHTTYIMSEDARTQAEFYIHAFGGELQSVMTHGEQMPDAKEELKDKVLNLSFVAAGVNFLMCDNFFGPVSYGNSLHLVMEFDTEAEAHEAFTKLSEGGQVNHPLERAFWGPLFGQIQDKFGVLWMITTATETN